MDKKIKKKHIPFQKKTLFSSMMVKFALILFLFVICYISYFGFNENYYPIRLSSFQYNEYKGIGNLLESNSNLPEGIDRTNDFSYAKNLAQCPIGSCVIDKKTGIKRCPEYVSNRLIYNIALEACTRLESCDFEKLPYAVHSNGSSDQNICEKGFDGNWIPCRCTDNKTCKPNVVSKFDVYGGENFGITQNYAPRNFQISKIFSSSGQSELGYFNVELEDLDQFCEVNPGFTDIIVDGCDFKNSIQDKLGCDFISNINFFNVNENNMTWLVGNQKFGEFYNASTGVPGTEQTNNNPNPIKGNTYLVLVREKDPSSTSYKNQFPARGYISITGYGGNPVVSIIGTQTIEYGKILQGEEKVLFGGKDYESIILINIVNLKSSLNEEMGYRGLAFSFINDFTDGGSGTATRTTNLTGLRIQNVSSNFCRFTNQSPNYKNLLLCTQSKKKVCNYGKLTYNIDKLRTLDNNVLNIEDESYVRNFCQLNPNKSNLLTNLDYLNDPIHYTMSCSIGQGCDGKNFQKDADDFSTQALERYFPEVDVDGINGSWDVTVSKFPDLDLNPKDQLINLSNVNPGDFWSIKTVNEILLNTEDLNAGVSIIKVDNLFGLDVFINEDDINPDLAPSLMFAGQDSVYKLVKAEYTGSDEGNFSSITIGPSLTAGVSTYTPITIFTDNVENDQTYGIITREDSSVLSSNPSSSNLKFSKLDGTPTTTGQFTGIQVNVKIYKQFSFSGANYNTLVLKNDSDVKNYGNFNRRLYVRGDSKPYKFKTDTNSLSYPYPPQDIFQLEINILKIKNPIYNSSFSLPNTPYKIPVSMYYPIWNPVSYQQECVRCKPLLLAFPELNEVNKIGSVIIQFSGKDFGNYEYDFKSKNFCYVTHSFLDFDNSQGINTTQRIFLEEPNPNIMVGDYILDSTLQLEHEIDVSDTNLQDEPVYNYLQIVPEIFPSHNAVKQINSKIFTENLGKIDERNPPGNTYPFSFGIEESTSTNYKINGEEYYPNMKGHVKKEGGNYIFVPDTDTLPNNYFFGKKYQPAGIYNYTMQSKQQGNDQEIPTSGFYFRPILKVISIQGNTIITNSPFPIKLKNPGNSEKIVIQFCRIDSPLKIETISTESDVFSNTELKVTRISDSRITNIGVASSDEFLKNNLPVIKVGLENQNFI